MTENYKVFIGNSFQKTKEGSNVIISTLLEHDCFPTTLDLFSASNEDSWVFIEKVITDCDFYVLFLDTQHGFTTPSEMNCAEKAYHYATEQKKPRLIFAPESLESIDINRNSFTEEERQKLQSFINVLKNDPFYITGATPSDLASALSGGLAQLHKHSSIKGWTQVDHRSESSENEILILRQQIDELKKQLTMREADDIDINNLAFGLEHKIASSPHS